MLSKQIQVRFRGVSRRTKTLQEILGGFLMGFSEFYGALQGNQGDFTKVSGRFISFRVVSHVFGSGFWKISRFSQRFLRGFKTQGRF